LREREREREAEREKREKKRERFGSRSKKIDGVREGYIRKDGMR
jgi:hypothetical protein